jgi:hypothetical protein
MVDKLFCVFVYIKTRIWYQKCNKEDISLKPISVKMLKCVFRKQPLNWKTSLAVALSIIWHVFCFFKLKHLNNSIHYV